MEQTTELGLNKTGMDMSPMQSKKMLEISDFVTSDTSEEHSTLSSLEQSYLEDTDPLGSVPLPGTVKGMMKSAMQKVTGRHPEVLINKLGERLAYERSGVRIYEHLIMKCQHANTNGMAEQQLPVERLMQFRDEEAQHFDMLLHCMKTLGADPTAQTPDADASGVGASGLMKVIMDPRTSVSQSLQAMLTIEVADNAAWELLIRLANEMNHTEMAQQFQHALQQENIHLQQVRQWYEDTIVSQAKMNLFN